MFHLTYPTFHIKSSRFDLPFVTLTIQRRRLFVLSFDEAVQEVCPLLTLSTRTYQMVINDSFCMMFIACYFHSQCEFNDCIGYFGHANNNILHQPCIIICLIRGFISEKIVIDMSCLGSFLILIIIYVYVCDIHVCINSR